MKKYYCLCGNEKSRQAIRCKMCDKIHKRNLRLGWKHSEITKAKIGLAHKNKKVSKETRLKISQAMLGTKWSEISKSKLKNRIPWNKNLPMSEEQKHKLSIVRMGRFTGKDNPNWQNGISKDPYPFEFDDELKEQIRKRDNYTCQKCGITEEEHLIVYGMVLCIHHIDYNKENCEEDNLTTLCNECNLRVNYNRKHWTEYFKDKVSKFINRRK